MCFAIMRLHIAPRYLYPSSWYWKEYRKFYRLPVLAWWWVWVHGMGKTEAVCI